MTNLEEWAGLVRELSAAEDALGAQACDLHEKAMRLEKKRERMRNGRVAAEATLLNVAAGRVSEKVITPDDLRRSAMEWVERVDVEGAQP